MTVIEMPFRLGDAIRRARLDAGLDQAELAKQLEVSRPLVSRWENGKGCPDVRQMRRIAESTGAEYLYDLRNLPNPCFTASAGQLVLELDAA